MRKQNISFIYGKALIDVIQSWIDPSMVQLSLNVGPFSLSKTTIKLCLLGDKQTVMLML